MSDINPETDKMFEQMTSGLQLDWDITVAPTEPLRLPEWRPKDGAKVGLNPKIGQALAQALVAELSIVQQDFAALTKPAQPSQEDINHVYTSSLLQLMQEDKLPARVGDGVAVEGAAIVLTCDDDGDYEPALLTHGKTLFGDISGPGYGTHPDALEEDIIAYDSGAIEMLPPIHRKGLLLVLHHVSLCSADGYGEKEWESDLALVPITNSTIRLFGTVEL